MQSAVSQRVNSIKMRNYLFIIALLVVLSGQVRFLGLLQARINLP
jgi:hypothetical protein